MYIFMEGSGEGQVCVAKTGGNGEDNDLQVQIRGGKMAALFPGLPSS